MNEHVKREDILIYVDTYIRNMLTKPLMYCHNICAVYDVFVIMMAIRQAALTNFNYEDSFTGDLNQIIKAKALKQFKTPSSVSIASHLDYLNRESELPEFLLEVYKEIATKPAVKAKCSHCGDDRKIRCRDADCPTCIQDSYYCSDAIMCNYCKTIQE